MNGCEEISQAGGVINNLLHDCEQEAACNLEFQ